MPHRDPQTGKFVSSEGPSGEIEILSFDVAFSVPAANVAGATGQFYGDDGNFEGVKLYDVDDIMDRHRVGQLRQAHHLLMIQPTGTQTADSAATMSVELSASPSRQVVQKAGSAFEDVTDTQGTVIQVEGPKTDDTVDLIGPPLGAMAQGPFTDGTNGLGGGGGPGWDRVESHPIDYELDRRDEVFVNGSWEVQNLSDGPFTAKLLGQHVFEIQDA